MSEIIRINTITELHKMLGLEKPMHPLVSLIPLDEQIAQFDFGNATYVLEFYQVSFKEGICGELTYGRNTYDYQDGSVLFIKAGQAISVKTDSIENTTGGWTLLFHPDLIRKSELGQRMESFSFFSYDSHEALHISDSEKASLTELVNKIEQEYKQNIDRHTQNLIISNIGLMLDYCTRYYDRQFYLRTNANQDIVTRFDNFLGDYIHSGRLEHSGIPTVKALGEAMTMSSSYLSDLLKKQTGRNTQQHIQDKIIEQAKNRLLGTNDQVSQIAYSLGFNYSQHFSKMFKNHTGMSPAEYRKVH